MNTNKTKLSRLDQLRIERRTRANENVFTTLATDALRSTVEPFGLGPLLADDKDGGNVTTLRASIAGDKRYIREKDKYHARDRQEKYHSKELSKNRATYIDARRRIDGTFIDEYTGKMIPSGQESLEHVVSIQQQHASGMYMASNERKAAAAADPRNFAVIDRGANSSKGAREYVEWRDKHGGDGTTNKVRYGLDERRTKAAVRRGEAAIAAHLPGPSDKAKWYGKELSRTGAEAAGRIAVQQALGLILREFISAAFAEVNDIWRNGLILDEETKARRALLKRLRRVASRVLMRWQGVLTVGVIGGLRGFLSNVLTTLVNMIVATPKRVVRLLREGSTSFFNAAKTLVSGETGGTTGERAHAAMEILAAGAGIAVGVLAEEITEQALRSIVVLAPFSNALALAAAAFIACLATAVLTILVDRADPYGVVRQRETEALHNEITNRIAERRQQIWALINES
jgi:hypothetical protein